ncbi:MAG: helix-turn-helix transcriptional regulator [Proteobacteria bacterium]|nr:helix-turn-helix transcriptional regulator [Pseudomonadota bacterium]
MQENPRGQLDLLLLAVLRSRPMHGYAVVAVLAERSGGMCRFPEGTVYPALQALERKGLVASEWERVDGRRRRVYRLTRAGLAALVKKAENWKRLTRGIGTVLAWQE